MEAQTVSCARCGNTLTNVTAGSWACPTCGWQFEVQLPAVARAVTVPALLAPSAPIQLQVDVVHRPPKHRNVGVKGSTIAYVTAGFAFLSLLSYAVYLFEFRRIEKKVENAAQN